MNRTFSINHPLLFLLAGIAVLAVALQSVVFLRKAWVRAKELGFSQEKLRKIAVSAAVFSIAPAIAVGIGVITLSGALGLPLPWLIQIPIFGQQGTWTFWLGAVIMKRLLPCWRRAASN